MKAMNKKYRAGIVLASVAVLCLPSCQKGSRYMEDEEQRDCPVSYTPSVSSLTEVVVSKGALINEGGPGATVKPLEEALPSTVSLDDFSFHVAAWDLAGTETVQSIPGPGGAFSEVKYFKTAISGGVSRNSWNTVGSDGKIKEYMWGSYKDRTERKVHGIRKAFYAYANLSAGSDAPTVTVDGTTKLPGAMSLEFKVASAAADQKDLLVGYYTGEGADAESGNPVGRAYLNFHHPMSSVILKLGNIKGVNTLTINTLSIEGVHSGGVLEMTPTGSGNAVTMAWTLASGEGSTKDVSQPIGLTLTAGTPAGTVLGEPFIVLPQDFKAAPARIVANVTADGRTFNICWPLDPDLWTPAQKAKYRDEWTMGNTYVYKLNFNGHEGVQLWANGPYWATRNVGAAFPEDRGHFFTWGNVKGYVPTALEASVYGAIGSNCTWVSAADASEVLEGGFTTTTYSSGVQGSGNTLQGNIPANATNDAAYKERGSKWRIPTAEELAGLADPTKTTIAARSINGVIGALFTGQGDYSGRSIFLPDCGYGTGTLYVTGDVTHYWSSTKGAADASNPATVLQLRYHHEVGVVDEYIVTTLDAAKDMGRLIRPVENTDYASEATLEEE